MTKFAILVIQQKKSHPYIILWCICIVLDTKPHTGVTQQIFRSGQKNLTQVGLTELNVRSKKRIYVTIFSLCTLLIKLNYSCCSTKYFYSSKELFNSKCRVCCTMLSKYNISCFFIKWLSVSTGRERLIPDKLMSCGMTWSASVAFKVYWLNFQIARLKKILTCLSRLLAISAVVKSYSPVFTQDTDKKS